MAGYVVGALLRLCAASGIVQVLPGCDVCKQFPMIAGVLRQGKCNTPYTTPYTNLSHRVSSSHTVEHWNLSSGTVMADCTVTGLVIQPRDPTACCGPRPLWLACLSYKDTALLPCASQLQQSRPGATTYIYTACFTQSSSLLHTLPPSSFLCTSFPQIPLILLPPCSQV